MAMRTSIALSFILLISAGRPAAQTLWHEGIVRSKTGVFECRASTYSRIIVNKVCSDKRVDLPWGIDPNRGQVSVTINSERQLFNAVTTAIPNEKLLAMVETKENYFWITFYLTETGEIMRIDYSLYSKTLITPDEVATMDSLIRENLRFKVVSSFDFGEPHIQMQEFHVRTIEVLNGEIGSAKRNERRGKKHWELLVYPQNLLH